MAATFTQDQLLSGEIGAIRKSPHGRLRIALCYPNHYNVGMSNLGFQTIYRLFNEQADVVCERAFLPDTLSSRTPLRTLESGTPLAEMDVVAFSVSFELDYPNIPRMLRLGGIEPFAAKRQGPLVLAGGATVSYNPEPIAPFLDMAIIGEAEEIVAPFIQALNASYEQDSLDPVAALPGLYLPARGTLPTERLAVRDLNNIPIYNQIFSEHTEFGHMALVEVSRGCPYGCRFCVASHVYKPARWRALDALLPAIERGLQYRQRVGMIGASVTDHPQIVQLCEEIIRRGGQPSPASMRAEALTDELLALFVQGDVRSVTLAPEAAREQLRYSLGKRLSNDALFSAAERVRRAGINHLKLYFIVGLPGETDDDVAEIPRLVTRLAEESGLRISLGCSAFVPKPGTPFVRQPMATERSVRKKFELIRRALRGKAEFTHESARWAYWQAVLARGGRELAMALDAIARGNDSPGTWNEAFQMCGLDGDQYALRDVPKDEPLPWSHIGARRYP